MPMAPARNARRSTLPLACGGMTATIGVPLRRSAISGIARSAAASGPAKTTATAPAPASSASTENPAASRRQAASLRGACAPPTRTAAGCSLGTVNAVSAVALMGEQRGSGAAASVRSGGIGHDAREAELDQVVAERIELDLDLP